MFEAGPLPPDRRCANCGAPLRETDRFCSSCGREVAPPQAPEPSTACTRCGASLGAGQRFCTNCGAPVVAPSGAEPVPGAYPLHYTVPYPEKLSRLLIFVKWLLAIPHFIIVAALGYAAAAVTVVAFFAILFTGRYPRGLFNLVVGINRWSANVTAYTYLFRDEYPPFSLDPGRYPVDYDVPYPDRLSRWLIWVKWLLVIPHQVVVGLLSIVGFFFGFIAWFAILFTGRYPRGLFNFNVGLQRWILRIGAYSGLLRDEFPPYSKRADAGPGSRRAIILSAIFGVIIAVTGVALYVVAIVALSGESKTVEVSYDRVMAGEDTAPTEVNGTVVVLESAEDPFEDASLGPADGGDRFVAFGVSIRNDDSLITLVDEVSFWLYDDDGDRHGPVAMTSVPTVEDSLLEEDEQARVTIVFEIDSADDPETLVYSPLGPIRFGPFGGQVRFEFR
jgi:hypothetical protein